MDSHKLVKFDLADYYKEEIDTSYESPLPTIELKENGIELVAQYYEYKYQVPKLVKVKDEKELIEKMKSQDFLQIRQSSDDTRIPIQITGPIHSCPAAYIKQNGKEYVLIFDSIGDTNMALAVANSFPNITVYTTNTMRQRDLVSCHAEAQIFLRELTGKEQDGKFLIPDLITKLERNKLGNFQLMLAEPGDDQIRKQNLYLYLYQENNKIFYSSKAANGIIKKQEIHKSEFVHFDDLLTILKKSDPSKEQPNNEIQSKLLEIISKRGHTPPNNIHMVKLFDSLLMTIQTTQTRDKYIEKYESDVIVHKHQTNPENIKDFLTRYPPENMRQTGPKLRLPNVSGYLRQKGIKFAHIIEIQFYLNQMQALLGDKFSNKIKDDFISVAKQIVKQDIGIRFLSQKQKQNLYDLAEKFVSETLAKRSAEENVQEINVMSGAGSNKKD